MKILNYIKNILNFFNLESELENQETVHQEILKGIIFRGTNLWILIFAIIIASVGLNMNSTAVIIGAMLISPLMGPINGIGYSIATYDLILFKKSVKNFTFAIIASLTASTIYFYLSPISTAHSEILARTSPTIYDVLIALFGGLAGIVAISTKQKGNVIPGVAIATALMPPLCTAGYGLATGQFNFFFGAFYLFTINTIFIAIASVWISQILQFPIRSLIDEQKKKKIGRITNFLIVIVLLPSIYFGYKLVKQEEFLQKAKLYVMNVSDYEGNYLLKHEINPKERSIELVYGGTTLLEIQKKAIELKSADFNIIGAKITIRQGLAFSNVDDNNIELYKLKEQIISLNQSINLKNNELDSLFKQKKFGKTLLNEIKPFFNQINGCSFSETYNYIDSLKAPIKSTIICFDLKTTISNEEKIKIKNWLKNRLKKEELIVLYNLKNSISL